MHDFIAIGDTVVDAFIRLKDARVNCDIDDNRCTITMAFGEKIPYESVEEIPAVGNSANACVAASRLGLKSALIANVGSDSRGHECLESLRKDNVDTNLIKIEAGKKTNYHFVLWYEHDRTILVKHEDFEYNLPEFGEPKWLYLSSLASNTERYHEEIFQYLSAHPEVNLAFQPGTFQISLGTEKLKEIYKRAKIFVSNVEEAEKILGIDTLGIQELLKRLRELGPEIVVITDGPNGAYAHDGSEMLFQPIYPQKPAYDRTGAGDAFASTTVIAMVHGNDLKAALKWASVNAASVCQELGAQKGLLNRAQIEEYLKSAPPEFETKVI